MKRPAVFIIILLLALIASNAWWALRDFGACDRFLYHEEVSPDGKHGIFMLYSNCGATAPFATQAVLWPAGRSFPRTGYEPFLVVKDLHELEVHWRDNVTVEVTLPQNWKVYRRESSSGGVTVIYR